MTCDVAVENHFSEPIDYGAYSHWLSNEVAPKLPRRGGINLTPHSFRSTFYLWYQLGDGKFDEARLNARHASKTEADKYWCDAATISEMLISEPRLLELHAVAPARSRIVHHNGQVVGAIIDAAGGSEVWTLAEAAKFFVEIMLEVSERNSLYHNPEYLLQLSRDVNFAQMNIPSSDDLIADLNIHIAPLLPDV